MQKDNIVFEDKNSKVTFNHYSFCELVKWIMVKYCKTTYENANTIVEKSRLYEEPKSYFEACLMTHELPFHWAMLLFHGDMYWLKGIPSDYNEFEEEYQIWEAKIIRQHKLKAPYQYEVYNQLDG